MWQTKFLAHKSKIKFLCILIFMLLDSEMEGERVWRIA